jgi:membrane protease YdiL (CAAX protease family)
MNDRNRVVMEPGAPTIWGVARLFGRTVSWVFHDRVAQIVASTFSLLLLWGTHGHMDLVGYVLDGWTGPGGDPATRAKLIPGLPWDQEWIAFGTGFLLLVVVPCLLIRFVFHEKIADYGLGLPRRGTWKFALISSALFGAVMLPAIVLTSRDPVMRATYPFYRNFAGTTQFLVYEAGYFVFFLVIEFIFRGYLLLGLNRIYDRQVGSGPSGESGPLVFGNYAILLSMLSYTAWHLGKPIPEQFGTLFFGLATGAIVLVTRSIWPIVVVHFALNVLLDYLIWTG